MFGKNRKKKKIIAGTIAVVASMGLLINAFAAQYYPIYGSAAKTWGEKAFVTGDMRKSNLSAHDSQPATIHWHGLKFYDLFYQDTNRYANANGVTNGTNNRNGYFTFSQFSIDNAPNNLNGYFFMPVDETFIRYFAKMSNGDPDYLWNQVKSLGNANMSTDAHPTIMKDDNGGKWVDVGSMLALSGGGYFKTSPEWDTRNLSAGVSSPRYETTAVTTPKPVIDKYTVVGKETATQPIQAGETDKIHIDGRTFAKYNGGTHVRFFVEPQDGQASPYYKKDKPDPGDPAWAVFTGGAANKTGGNSFTFPYKQDVDVKSLVWQNTPGKYKLTLQYLDPYGRKAEKVMTIDYQPNAFNLKALQLVPSTKPRNGDIVYYNFQVVNESTAPVKTMVGFNSSLGNPLNIANRPATYTNYQWTTGGNIPGNINEYNFPPKTPVWVNDVPIKIPKNPDGSDPAKFYAVAGINYYNLDIAPNTKETIFPNAASWPVDNFKYVEGNLNSKPNFKAVKLDMGIGDACSA